MPSRMTTRLLRTSVAAALTGAAIAVSTCAPGPSWAGATAPAADRVGPAVTNYTRISDDVAASGRLGDGAVGELKSAGFAAIVDLRSPDEGTDAEKQAATAAGLRYFNIPIAKGTLVPSGAQVAELARLFDDRGNFPVLVHCASGARAGAMWALYRVESGAPAATALEEARRIGVKGEREAALAKGLGLAP